MLIQRTESSPRRSTCRQQSLSLQNARERPTIVIAPVLRGCQRATTCTVCSCWARLCCQHPAACIFSYSPRLLLDAVRCGVSLLLLGRAAVRGVGVEVHDQHSLRCSRSMKSCTKGVTKSGTSFLWDFFDQLGAVQGRLGRKKLVCKCTRREL